MRNVALRMKEILLAFLLLKRRRVSMSQSEQIALIALITNFSTDFLPGNTSVLSSCLLSLLGECACLRLHLEGTNAI